MPSAWRTVSMANTDSRLSVSALRVMNGMLPTPPAAGVLLIRRVMWVSVYPASAWRSSVFGSSMMACVTSGGSGVLRKSVGTERSNSSKGFFAPGAGAGRRWRTAWCWRGDGGQPVRHYVLQQADGADGVAVRDGGRTGDAGIRLRLGGGGDGEPHPILDVQRAAGQAVRDAVQVRQAVDGYVALQTAAVQHGGANGGELDGLTQRVQL